MIIKVIYLVIELIKAEQSGKDKIKDNKLCGFCTVKINYVFSVWSRCGDGNKQRQHYLEEHIYVCVFSRLDQTHSTSFVITNSRLQQALSMVMANIFSSAYLCTYYAYYELQLGSSVAMWLKSLTQNHLPLTTVDLNSARDVSLLK